MNKEELQLRNNELETEILELKEKLDEEKKSKDLIRKQASEGTIELHKELSAQGPAIRKALEQVLEMTNELKVHKKLNVEMTKEATELKQLNAELAEELHKLKNPPKEEDK